MLLSKINEILDQSIYFWHFSDGARSYSETLFSGNKGGRKDKNVILQTFTVHCCTFKYIEKHYKSLSINHSILCGTPSTREEMFLYTKSVMPLALLRESPEWRLIIVYYCIILQQYIIIIYYN